jgi:hypothetical protein
MPLTSQFRTPRFHLLEVFLESSFNDLELRELAMVAFDDGRLLSRSLPGTGASTRQLAYSIVTLIDHHYGTPPPSLWAHLHATRRGRREEIEQIRVQFDGGQALGVLLEPTPVSTTAGEEPPPTCNIIVEARPHGSRDLLELLDLWVRAASTSGSTNATATMLREHFSELRAGHVNGLPRRFVIEWTDRALNLQVTPYLYRDGQRMPAAVVVKVPVEAVTFTYYPCGRHDFRATTGGPRAYGVRVEAWDARLRRIILTNPQNAQFTVEFRRTKEAVT